MVKVYAETRAEKSKETRVHFRMGGDFKTSAHYYYIPPVFVAIIRCGM